MFDVEVKNLTKKYKEKLAVNNVSFNIEQGELFGLLGTNGAGKTTIIKVLSSLVLPTEGQISIGGYDLSKDKYKIKEIINVSPQESAVAQNLSVKENLEFMAGVYQIAEKESKIESLIDQFGLGEVIKQKAKTLSGGYQRRLSIALALINQPKILFLDEPTLGLDVIARRELWQVIEGLKGKITIILTTHYMEEAESLCDRVAIMNEGSILKIGTPNDIVAENNLTNFEEAFVKIVSGGNK